MTSKKTFIWDEIDDPENNIEGYDTRTVSSLKFESPPNLQPNGNIASQISRKLESMKVNLAAHTNKAKEMMAELRRLKEAKERRLTKARKEWDKKLLNVREENSSNSHKLEEFYQRLQGDITKLQEQANSIEERMAKTLTQHEETLEKARQDIDRNLKRVKRQWENEEKITCEKVALTKADTLQKQAAESFGPKINSLVSDGKQKVAQLKEEGEVKLQKLQLSLQSIYETNLSQRKEELNNHIKSDVEKVKRQLQRQQEERTKQYQDELQLLREKQLRDRQVLEDNYEQTLRIEQEQCQESKQALIRREGCLVQEVLATQEREMGYLTKIQSEAISQLKEQLQEQQQKEQHRCQHLQKHLKEQRLLQRINANTRRLAAETERILQKLHEDEKLKRHRLQQKSDDEVAVLREKAQRQSDLQQQNEQSEINRISTLQSEVSNYKQQLSKLQSKIDSCRSSIQGELHPTLQNLRHELKTAESEFNNLGPKHEKALADRRIAIDTEVHALEDKLLSLRERARKLKSEQDNESEETEQQYVVELTRIKDKISSLLRKKESSREELLTTLTSLQTESRELQCSLDRLRDCKFG